MARSRQHGVTLQHTQYADEIVAWLKMTGGTPLEIGVVEEIRDRLKEHAKNGAIVRVRLKNRGSLDKARHDTLFDRNWSPDEIDQLRILLREGCGVVQVADRMERTQSAIESKMKRTGLRCTPANQLRKTASGEVIGERMSRGRGVLARARTIREERLRAEQSRRLT